jgi:hypothetical protein
MASLANEKRQIQLRQQIRETEKARDAEVDAAQDKVDAAQEEMDAVTAQIELQKSSIEVQIEQNNLLREQIELLEELSKPEKAGIGKEIADAMKGMGGAGGALNIQDKMKDAIEGAKNTIKTKLGELWITFKGKFKPIEDAWKNLKRAWGPTVSVIWEHIKGLFKKFGTLLSDIFKGDWKKVPGDIWAILKDQLEFLWVMIKAWVSSIDWKKLWDELGKAIEAVGDWLGPKLVELGKLILVAILLGLVSLGILIGTWLRETAWPQIKEAWESVKDRFLESWEGLKENIVKVATSIWEAFKKGIEQLWGDISGVWEGFKKQLVDAWNTVKDRIVKEPDGIVPTMWRLFKEFIETAWGKVTGVWDTFKGSVTTAWTTLKDAIVGENGIIPKLWESFKNSIENAWGTVTTAWDGFKSSVTQAWTNLVLVITGVGGLVEILWSKFKSSITNAWDYVKGAWETFKQSLIDWWNKIDWGALGQKVVNAIINGITSGADAIWNAIKDAIGVGSGSSGELSTGSFTPPGKASGGLISHRGLYELAERGPELVLPADLTRNLFAALRSSYRQDLGSMGGYRSGNSYNNSRTVNLTINPSYEQVQSPAGIRYDVTAALMAARL